MMVEASGYPGAVRHGLYRFFMQFSGRFLGDSDVRHSTTNTGVRC
jgi:hypothetical protein